MSEIMLYGDSGLVHEVTFQGLYSDNTPFIKIENLEEVAQSVHTMVVRPSSLKTFVTAMFLVDSLDEVGGIGIDHLVLPYVPGARQDRVNPTGDVLFTAKSVARMINQQQFSKVTILDPHSDVIASLIANVEVYPLYQIGKRLWSGYTGVIAPDKGAKRRAAEIAQELGKPIYYGGKTRDVSNGKLTGFTLEDIPFGHYLVVDDICDGGGTFVGLGEKIREQGSYADLYVSHGIFAKGYDDLLKIYKNIYTTDSLEWNSHPNVYRIPVIERMINND